MSLSRSTAGTSEASPLALPVQGAPDPRIAAGISQLAGDPQASRGGKGAKHRHNDRDVANGDRRDLGETQEEQIKNDRSKCTQPERKSKMSEQNAWPPSFRAPPLEARLRGRAYSNFCGHVAVDHYSYGMATLRRCGPQCGFAESPRERLRAWC